MCYSYLFFPEAQVGKQEPAKDLVGWKFLEGRLREGYGGTQHLLFPLGSDSFLGSHTEKAGSHSFQGCQSVLSQVAMCTQSHKASG